MKQLHWNDVPEQNRERAKELRRNSTLAERKLWSQLRSYRNDVKFRRQQPVGSYIVDFLSPDCRLIIEVDGDTHGSEEARAYDAERTKYLEQLGYRVLRYQNRDVMKNFDNVISSIHKIIDEL